MLDKTGVLDELPLIEEIVNRSSKYSNVFMIYLQGARYGRSSIKLARQVALEVIKSVETLDNRIHTEISINPNETKAVSNLLIEASTVMDLVAQRLSLDLDAEDGGASAATEPEEASANFELYCSYEKAVRGLIENNSVMVAAYNAGAEEFVNNEIQDFALVSRERFKPLAFRRDKFYSCRYATLYNRFPFEDRFESAHYLDSKVS